MSRLTLTTLARAILGPWRSRPTGRVIADQAAGVPTSAVATPVLPPGREGHRPEEARAGTIAGSHEDSALIHSSGLFDSEAYAGRPAATVEGLDPVEHYLRSGESRGYAPSALFDPLYYGACNTDVRATGQNLLLHYLRDGRAEGRSPLPVITYLGAPPPASGERTILVLVGAPDARPAPLDPAALAASFARRGSVLLLDDTADMPELTARWQDSALSVVGLPRTLHSFEVGAILRRLRHRHAPAFALALVPIDPVRRRGYEAAGIAVVRLSVDAPNAPEVSSDREAGQAARVIRLETEDPLPHAASLPAALMAYGTQRLPLPCSTEELVTAIEALGQQAARDLKALQRDRDVILSEGVFNPRLYLGYASGADTASVVELYLRTSRRLAPRSKPLSGIVVRRPFEGFHPFLYAGASPDYDESRREDPLAHFARMGRPQGPWLHEILRPTKGSNDASALRIGIHGHFHYPDLLPDFLGRLGRNASRFDLLLTTSDAERATLIGEVLATRGQPRTQVLVVPNRGRDLGPFLTQLGAAWADRYDLVGHLHGKRTAHADASIGETWRTFLWDNLVGGKMAMIDRIARAFAEDEGLGLVFAEDPKLIDWDNNRDLAEALAVRMGSSGRLPDHLNFPQGTMFWARPKALAPLFALGLRWEDYPAEPVPIDGTMLHALERLLTHSARLAGYRYATTLVEDAAW